MSSTIVNDADDTPRSSKTLLDNVGSIGNSQTGSDYVTGCQTTAGEASDLVKHARPRLSRDNNGSSKNEGHAGNDVSTTPAFSDNTMELCPERQENGAFGEKGASIYEQGFNVLSEQHFAPQLLSPEKQAIESVTKTLMMIPN